MHMAENISCNIALKWKPPKPRAAHRQLQRTRRPGDSTNAWQQVKRRGKKSSRGPSSDATKRQGELKGATRIKKSVFCISGIDVSCPEDTLVNYCLSRQVRVESCRFLKSKHFGTQSARLVVSAEDAQATNMVNESFWPENITARPWKFPETVPDRKDEHPRWPKARSQWLQQLNLQDKTWHPFRLWRLQTARAMHPQVPP